MRIGAQERAAAKEAVLRAEADHALSDDLQRKIKERIDGLLQDHGLPPDATDFGDDYLLQCSVTELRWCLKLSDGFGERIAAVATVDERKRIVAAADKWLPDSPMMFGIVLEDPNQDRPKKDLG
jgi:hypothetical protein